MSGRFRRTSRKCRLLDNSDNFEETTIAVTGTLKQNTLEEIWDLFYSDIKDVASKSLNSVTITITTTPHSPEMEDGSNDGSAAKTVVVDDTVFPPSTVRPMVRAVRAAVPGAPAAWAAASAAGATAPASSQSKFFKLFEREVINVFNKIKNGSNSNTARNVKVIKPRKRRYSALESPSPTDKFVDIRSKQFADPRTEDRAAAGEFAFNNDVFYIVGGEVEAMEIDSTTVPPPQEYSDSPATTANYPTESSMNFDYLQSLHSGNNTTDTTMDSTSSSTSSQRHFYGIGGGAAGGGGGGAPSTSAQAQTATGHVDDSKVLDRPFDMNERFVSVLDQLDARVEKFRKDAMGLRDKRDFLMMSVDLIRSHDHLQNMTESERDEIHCYIQRVNSRLSTVDLTVRTVRDCEQENALSQINVLIDMMITMGDPVVSRQRCQQYLNACSSSLESVAGHHNEASSSACGIEMDVGPVDKKFENTLLGCTLDDQKNIKKRLQALMNYLNKQTIRNHPSV